MDPFTAFALLELAKEDKITSLAVCSSAVFLGTENGKIFNCAVSLPQEEEGEVR